MCAYKCDSCFHNKVCDEEPAFFAVNKECALYTNEKILTDIQQLKADMSLLVAVCKHNLRNGNIERAKQILESMDATLSAV